MAIIGYVTLEEANQYVATHFITTDSLRVGWEALSDEDKTSLLNRSFLTIEALPFTGRKTDPSQPNAFPRCPVTEVPEAVKYAQIENAVSLSDPSSADEAAFYQRLWQYGVESYSIGNLSEKTSTGAWGRGASGVQGIVSTRASSMLQPFLGGSYTISGLIRRCKP